MKTEFAENEMNLLYDRFNGVMIETNQGTMSDEYFRHNLKSALYFDYEIADDDTVVMSSYDINFCNKWGVDGKILDNKIKALELQEALELINKIKSFWEK